MIKPNIFINEYNTFLSFYIYLVKPPLGCPPPSLTSKYSLYSLVSGGFILTSFSCLVTSKVSDGEVSGRASGFPMYS